jgi:hypothetical protein
VLVLLVPACADGGGAAAGCGGFDPVVLSPDSGAPSTSVELTVGWLQEGCNDYPGADEVRPLTDVPVIFSQRDVETQVGTISATEERYRGTMRFEVPATARPGPAELHLGRPDSPGPGVATFTVE